MAKEILNHLLIAVGSLVLGGAVGFAGVYLSAKWSWERQNSPEANRVRAVFPVLARVGMMSLYVTQEHDEVGDRQKSLVEFRNELLRTKQELEPGELRQGVTMNLGFTYLQLARFERENGRAEQAANLVSQAQAEFRSIGWTDLSESALNAALNRRLKDDCCGKEYKQ